MSTRAYFVIARKTPVDARVAALFSDTFLSDGNAPLLFDSMDDAETYYKDKFPQVPMADLGASVRLATDYEAEHGSLVQIETGKDRIGANRYASMKVHGIKAQSGFALPVLLTGGENEYLKFPCRGVIVAMEQGSVLRYNFAVFHLAKEDGSLGAPVAVRHPVFTYDGGDLL